MGGIYMTEKTTQENKTLVAFRDKDFALSEEDQKQMLEDGGSDWKEIAPSEKLYIRTGRNDL